MPNQFAPQARTYRRPSLTASSTSNHPKRAEMQLTLKACRYIKETYPQAIVLHDFAAGLNLKDSDRMQMMATRSEDGQPDLSVDYPSRGYHGLRLEIKAEGVVIFKKDGKLRAAPYTRKYKKSGKLFIKKGDHLQEQAATLRKYNNMGYYGNFAVGWLQLKRIIDWYFKNENASLF